MGAVTISVRVLAAVAAVLFALLPAHGVGAQSAEAATVAPNSATGAKPPPDGLFGNFSLTSERGPLQISADKLEFDYQTSILTYRGSVTVKQADLTLSANVLRVTLDPKATDQLREVVAEGEVRIAKGDRRASGGRAVFDQAKRTIVLSDRATLSDGPNEVAGERVVVYLDEERSVIEGGTDRVRAVLFPSDNAHKAADDEGGAAEAPAGAKVQTETVVEESAVPARRDVD